MRDESDDGNQGNHQSSDSLDLLNSLQARADALLNDLTSFQSYLKESRKDKDVEIRHFMTNVLSEVKSLAKLRSHVDFASTNTGSREEAEDFDAEEEAEGRRLHMLRSSNLPFYESVWNAARQCRSIKALEKRIYFTNEFVNAPPGTACSNTRRQSVLVDIIADNGLEWIKVSTNTERRLLFEMAREGWEGYGDESDSAESACDGELSPDANKTPVLELVRLAKNLAAASKQTRVHFRHPRVRFILPKITEGQVAEVDAVLADLRASGATVSCANNVARGVDGLAGSAAFGGLDNRRFAQLLPSQLLQLTPTLNIDCTILLALISDISHLPRSSLPPSPNSYTGTYHSAVLRQIESEEASPLLPNELYRAFEGRDLVCTAPAATRMREIIDTMGTAGERARAEIIFAAGPFARRNDNISPEAMALRLRQALSSFSTYPVPNDLRLPIHIVDFTYHPSLDLLLPPLPQTKPDPQMTLPSNNSMKNAVWDMALTTSRSLSLSPINASVFLYGWLVGLVTITSNRSVAQGIEKTVNSLLDQFELESAANPARRPAGGGSGGDGDDDDHSEQAKTWLKENIPGPQIWVCETARSLVGKDKTRKDGSGDKRG